MVPIRNQCFKIAVKDEPVTTPQTRGEHLIDYKCVNFSYTLYKYTVFIMYIEFYCE